jgi:hypothetical protein
MERRPRPPEFEATTVYMVTIRTSVAVVCRPEPPINYWQKIEVRSWNSLQRSSLVAGCKLDCPGEAALVGLCRYQVMKRRQSLSTCRH